MSRTHANRRARLSLVHNLVGLEMRRSRILANDCDDGQSDEERPMAIAEIPPPSVGPMWSFVARAVALRDRRDVSGPCAVPLGRRLQLSAQRSMSVVAMSSSNWSSTACTPATLSARTSSELLEPTTATPTRPPALAAGRDAYGRARATSGRVAFRRYRLGQLAEAFDVRVRPDTMTWSPSSTTVSAVA